MDAGAGDGKHAAAAKPPGRSQLPASGRVSDEIRRRFRTAAARRSFSAKTLRVKFASDRIICSFFKGSQKEKKKIQKDKLDKLSPLFLSFPKYCCHVPPVLKAVWQSQSCFS